MCYSKPFYGRALYPIYIQNSSFTYTGEMWPKRKGYQLYACVCVCVLARAIEKSERQRQIRRETKRNRILQSVYLMYIRNFFSILVLIAKKKVNCKTHSHPLAAHSHIHANQPLIYQQRFDVRTLTIEWKKSPDTICTRLRRGAKQNAKVTTARTTSNSREGEGTNYIVRERERRKNMCVCKCVLCAERNKYERKSDEQ